MNIQNSLLCIYYNTLSNFYIFLNMIFPYYSEDILNLQYRTIENINETIVFQNNCKKRRRFDIFVENLILKNNELIEKIRQQEEEDNNLNNYEKINEDNDDIIHNVIQDSDDTDSGDNSDNDKKNN